MGKIEAYEAELEQLVWDPKSAAELAEKLMAESNLPGPRGNLELAEAFARAVSTAAAEPAAWLETLYTWAHISAEEAPTGDPREFLPFCAVVSFGVLYNTHACSYPCTGPCDCPLWPRQSEHLVETIRRSASDSRWRIREAAAMSLQHLGEALRILKKGLSYALSVIAAQLPEEGFPLLERWTQSSDPDIRQVLAANLKKKRLEAADSKRVAGLLQKLSG